MVRPPSVAMPTANQPSTALSAAIQRCNRQYSAGGLSRARSRAVEQYSAIQRLYSAVELCSSTALYILQHSTIPLWVWGLGCSAEKSWRSTGKSA